MPVQPIRLELDSSVRRFFNGTALVGGSPFRLIRLSNAGAELLDRWFDGRGRDDGEIGSAEQALLDRLIDAGVVHPVPNTDEAPASVGIVVPVHDDPIGLARLLTAVRREQAEVPIAVVDDASSDPSPIAAVADEHGARLHRLPKNSGPAAARNAGWQSLRDQVDIVVMLDADVVPAAGSLARLLAHFVDPAVNAVAPRVRAAPGVTSIDQYEQCESPLDLGDASAIVAPGSKVPYVPTAALAIRMATLVEADGFDESLRVGEDVDLVWRIAGGRRVRFAPEAVVHHRNRASLRSLAAQRHAYGSAAAPLAARHGQALAPVDLPVLTAAAWLALAFLRGPRRAVAFGFAAIEAVGLYRRLAEKVDDPVGLTLSLSAQGHRHAGRWLAKAVTRAWGPLFAIASVFSSRTRRVYAAAAIGVPALDWMLQRPPLDPARYVALRAIDDAAYCSGVWSGSLRHRHAVALLPRLRRVWPWGSS